MPLLHLNTSLQTVLLFSTSTWLMMFCGVGVIKGYQMTSVSITRAWQREKGESLEARCVESLLVVYLCVLSVSGLSLIVARDNPLARKG
jgi:hypothetical protein